VGGCKENGEGVGAVVSVRNRVPELLINKNRKNIKTKRNGFKLTTAK
jgi:hypothetical protein